MHRCFFSRVHDIFVPTLRTNAADLQTCKSEYAVAGFPGRDPETERLVARLYRESRTGLSYLEQGVPTTILPMKHTCNRSGLRFSQWLESLRKGVECTFGILKGRWRILKTVIRCHNTEVSDNIWMTSCTLHNLVMDFDGLSRKWNDGVASAYENEDGHFQDEEVPAAIRCLVDPTGNEGHRLRTFDDSRFGLQNTDFRGDNDDDHHEDIENVNLLSHIKLQLPLVWPGNFNIAFHKNKLVWPKQFAMGTKPIPILAAG